MFSLGPFAFWRSRLRGVVSYAISLQIRATPPLDDMLQLHRYLEPFHLRLELAAPTAYLRDALHVALEDVQAQHFAASQEA